MLGFLTRRAKISGQDHMEEGSSNTDQKSRLREEKKDMYNSRLA